MEEDAAINYVRLLAGINDRGEVMTKPELARLWETQAPDIKITKVTVFDMSPDPDEFVDPSMT
jgi:hypothetical protein